MNKDRVLELTPSTRDLQIPVNGGRNPDGPKVAKFLGS